MSKPRVLIVVGLVLSVMLERAAFFGVRSALSLWMAGELGMDHFEALEAVLMVMTAVAFAPLLGGALALAVGPRGTLVVGAGFAALGYAGLAVTDAGSPTVGLSLMVIGAGLFWPAWLVTLASEFAHPHGNLRTAVFLMAFVAINLAAMLGVLGAGFVRTGVGAATLFWLGAGVSVVVTVLAAGVVVLRKRAGPTADAVTFGARPALGAGVLMLLLLPYRLATSALERLLPAVRGNAIFEGGRWSTFLGLGAATALLLIAAAVFFTAARKGARPLALSVIGGALVVAALGVGLGLGSVAVPESSRGALSLLGSILAEGGGAVVVSVALARVAADMRPRTATLVVAIFIVAPRALAFVAPGAADATVVGIIAGAGVILSLLAGVGLLVFAGRMQRVFYTPQVGVLEPPA